jgi:CHAD domain-containing protein
MTGQGTALVFSSALNRLFVLMTVYLLAPIVREPIESTCAPVLISCRGELHETPDHSHFAGPGPACPRYLRRRVARPDNARGWARFRECTILSADLKKLVRRLDEEYRALSSGYAGESLHQFRVRLRRLRSLLRHDTSSRVRKLRCQLAKLARTTNAARDWDTLVSRARDSLSAQDFAHVQPLLERRQAESHLPVLQMLQSERWPDARRALKKIIKAHGGALAFEFHSDAGLTRARRRVNRAWRAVQAGGADRARHKLRIAIKDLGYRLKALPVHQRTAEIAAALALCKRLQHSLGVWHDALVHVQRVQELCDSVEMQGQPELLGILRSWCRKMELEAQDALQTAVADLAEYGGALLD